MTSDHIVAAVDIGTNSIKLLIQTNGQRHTESHVVRLGEGVNSTGRLQPAAVERAINLSAEKYCSASAMIAKTAKIEHSWTISEEGPPDKIASELAQWVK